jgi:uncharacterized SAM-dependent methyltransferase
MISLSLQKPLSLQEASLTPFQDDIATLFRGSRQGHLDRWQYATPLYAGDPVDGARLWENFLRLNPAYVYPQEETAALKQVVRQLPALAEPFDEFIEFGPGTSAAFLQKSVPITRALKARHYRPIDLCQKFLSDIQVVATQAGLATLVKGEHKDFLCDPIAAAAGPACIYWGGGGFSNIGTDIPATIPYAEIEHRFSRLRALLPHGGLALIAMDTCLDAERHDRAYNHSAYAQHQVNLFSRIQRDWPEAGLSNPAAFSYEPVWQPHLYLVEHQVTATASQTIWLDDEPVAIKAGDRFVIDHSFKFPTSFIAAIARQAGWEKTTVTGEDGHVQILVLGC